MVLTSSMPLFLSHLWLQSHKKESENRSPLYTLIPCVFSPDNAPQHNEFIQYRQKEDLD